MGFRGSRKITLRMSFLQSMIHIQTTRGVVSLKEIRFFITVNGTCSIFVDIFLSLSFSYHAYPIQKSFPLKLYQFTSLRHSFWALVYDRLSNFWVLLRMRAQVL